MSKYQLNRGNCYWDMNGEGYLHALKCPNQKIGLSIDFTTDALASNESVFTHMAEPCADHATIESPLSDELNKEI